jgi:TonB-linked SusC/RagA family outer membrane protein
MFFNFLYDQKSVMKKNRIGLRVSLLVFTMIFCFHLQNVYGQTKEIIVRGFIMARDSTPIVGATISLQGKTTLGKGHALSDGNGQFELIAPPDGKIVISFIGYANEVVPIENRTTLYIYMNLDSTKLEEVAVVAYGTQKKSSMVSSITTVNPKEIKGPTSNLTTMLAGRIAGLVSFQRSGEPGNDNAQFFIRGVTTFGAGKVDPLILIDGMESTSNDLARLQPDDIAGFSVLKDASAASLYGARGANGVILVTTKSGVGGRTKFNVRLENSLSSNTQNFKLADNITYMMLANEAVLTRNPIGVLPYSQTKIDHTVAGDNPLLYPNNDWIKLLIRDYTINQRVNANASGGGQAARYYISATYNQDNGVLKTDKQNNFDNNIKLRTFGVRTNVDVKLTPTTNATVRTSGTFNDYNGPVGGGANIFTQALSSNPVLFPAFFPASDLPSVHHPLFGNAILSGTDVFYNNPYASMVSGFQQYNTSTLNVQLEINQDLKFITPGLTMRGMAYNQRYAYFELNRQYNPFYYSAVPTNSTPSGYQLSLLNEKTATEYLNYNEGAKIVNTTTYGEFAVNYNHTFNKVHDVSGMLITTIRKYLDGNAGDLQTSLPFRNLGVSGRFTYGYDKRYLAEANFGYNGSERFAAKQRYGFFPSIGVAWNVSNEAFFSPLLDIVSKLKLRATYGLVGNDQIGDANDRFFYLSNVNLNDGNRGAYFGENYGYNRPGVSISRYANNQITWEEARTTNLGMDLTLLKDFNLVIDAYKQHRSNILMARSYIPTTMGLTAPVNANVGVAEGKGIDISLDYNKSFHNKTWLQLRSTFTYAASKLLVNEEPNYPANEWYLSRVGHPLSEVYGLIAERLFVDDDEVTNSPPQNYGEVAGGDIKYKDLNGDGQITDLDMVNGLGYPTIPEINYGFGFSYGYHDFDLSIFFQGSARSSFLIDPKAITPFVFTENTTQQHGLLEAIAKSHWSEDNRDVYAFWPRLSPVISENNTKPSNWWLRNGAFLRLKTAEIGYSLKGSSLKRLGMDGLRVYVNGSNLFLISGFKLWDPEQGSNGLGYPVQRVFNLGANIQF